MNKKLLLTLSTLALGLAACGGGGTSSSAASSSSSASASSSASSATSSAVSSEESSSVSSEESSSSESSSVSETLIEQFFGNIGEGNFTMTDEGYLSLTAISEEAVYYDYGTKASGYVLYEETRIFDFVIEENAVKLTGEETAPEAWTGGSLFPLLTTPYLLVGSEDYWYENDDGTYSTEDEDIIAITCALGSYSSAAAAYITSVTLDIEDDASSGLLSATIDTGENQYPIALTIDQLGTTTNAAIEAYLADPYEYVAPVDPGYLALYNAKVAEARNFTLTNLSDGDAWSTLYAVSDVAYFTAYSDVAKGYGAADAGRLIYDGNVYTFNLNEAGAVANLAFESAVDPDYPSLYDYIYSPLDCLDAEFEYVADGVYTTTDAMVAKVVAALNGYSSYSSYIDSVNVKIAEDGSSATFEAVSSAFEASVAVTNIGTTEVKGITEYFKNPYTPVAKTDWTDATKAIFTEAFGEVIPFYPGFTEKMVETDYLDSYGFYLVEDQGSADDAVAYGAILVENGWVLDEKESEVDPETGECAYIYRKTRADGKQIIVQSEWVPASELSESSAAQYPNGRFQIIMSLYTPPVTINGFDAISAAIAGAEVFPAIPDSEGATWVAIDGSEIMDCPLYLEVTITFASAEALSAWQAAYIETIEAAGFAYHDYYEDYENEYYDSVDFAADEENPLVLVVTFWALGMHF